MSEFAQKISSFHVPDGMIGIAFLGQAGFILKTTENKLIAIDPYLSDCCERYFGFKRLMPHILGASELIFDQIIVSHAHYDHFDPDSIPVLMSNGHTELIGAKDIKLECERLGIYKNVTYLTLDKTLVRSGVKVTGVRCDHGELAKDALGLLIEMERKRIYVTGDTSYRPDILENKSLQGTDLLILPINGAFGNLNEEEAVQVIKKLRPVLTVPCHYWNFAEHGGNPGVFQEKMKEIVPEISYQLMRQGEMMLL
ncbi:MBL fold metallo-hydrolase [Robinsoniella sp. KNHs210]|uniref:MBL fold metallo-hydrolase n=1 Tax=Robinsoniella sp. KNHs210 TaxID=1469950 RepID=UPI00048A319F|nr:MBL fold metallo-hydrolase [Robinsoniella sp. KNHs210]